MIRKEIIGDCTLYLGDSREVLKTLPPVDSVICDPPYGINLEYDSFKDTEDEVKNLISIFVPWAMENAKTTLITSGNQCQHLYPRPAWTLAWVTPAGSGSGPWGFCCRHDVIMHTESSEKNGHPCPKPINFMKKLIVRGSLPNQTVLDPFMGIGTTGVACIALGRKFIGIEISEKYFDISCERIRKAYDQADFFLPSPTKPKQDTLL